MISITRCTAIALLGIICAFPWEEARAWGNDGHKIVCAIALKLLPSRLRDQVDRLTASYETPDGWNYDYFTAGCTFPDLARRRARNKVPGWDYFKQFSNWHYLNVLRSTDEISADESCDNCILEGIDLHWDQLANEDLEDWQRAQALFFLGHWVGDLKVLLNLRCDPALQILPFQAHGGEGPLEHRPEHFVMSNTD